MNSELSMTVRGRLLSFSRPLVMGIVNATPDSFHAPSRAIDNAAELVQQMRADGADIIDVGACSTRPGSQPCNEEEELRRLQTVVPAVFSAWPEAIVSVDTFRPAVARHAVQTLGVHIINDVGAPADVTDTTDVSAAGNEECAQAGTLLSPMMAEAVRLGVPYILMSRARTVADMLPWLSARVEAMHALGHRDIIIDPGFGFGRSREEDLQLLAQLDRLQVLQLPLLVGLSRKRMAWQTLGTTPDDSLPATIALNALAVERGAAILRVHDVREAVQVATIVPSVVRKCLTCACRR